MDAKLKEALIRYALVIKTEGWAAGERVITDHEKEIPDFRRWCYAAGIMLRAEEILDDGGYKV